jgi:hypothetical protein
MSSVTGDSVLLTLQNPRYREVIASNSHLEGIEMDNVDTKPCNVASSHDTGRQ